MLLDESEEVAVRVEVQVEKLTTSGLVLTGPFFELLAGFEASDRDFEEYLPTLLRILPNPAGPR